MLKIGANKPLEIVNAQGMLRATEYYSGLVDGHFGDIMHESVKDFQKDNKLLVDGIIGFNTYRKLNAVAGQSLAFLFIHCSATKKSIDLSAERIARYHTKTLGWSREGYNSVIELDGTLKVLRNFDTDNQVDDNEFSWGVLVRNDKGARILNRNAHHVCYVGGLNNNDKAEDTRTNEQLDTLTTYIKFMLSVHPNLVVAGHNQVQIKACPSFNVSKWLREIEVSEHNILHTPTLVNI